MSPRKLTEDDKQEIIKLYRNSEATTSTLASDYGVSSSTISRFLKSQLSKTEYEDLIQQKRLARTPRGEKSTTDEQLKIALPQSQSLSKTEPVAADAVESERPTAKESAIGKVTRRRRRRSSATTETEEIAAVESATISQTDKQELISEKIVKEPIMTKSEEAPSFHGGVSLTPSDRPLLKKERLEEINDLNEENEMDEVDEVDVVALGEMLGEELVDIDDDEDDEDDDDWESDAEENFTYPHADAKDFDIEILPLSAASFPRTCYLVIDRSAELIVRPLKDFADLGSIPAEEVKQKTLPVFDNHRIAKRFSHRRERVIKVPDGRMLEKTSRYLNAKGITRILIDGQIYSL